MSATGTVTYKNILMKVNFPEDVWPVILSLERFYFASGLGRIWNFTAFGRTPGPPSPLPPSMCHVA